MFTSMLPLDLACGEAAEQMSNEQIPFYMHVSAKQVKPWVGVFAVFAYFPYTSIQVDLLVRCVKVQCIEPIYYPCIFRMIQETEKINGNYDWIQDTSLARSDLFFSDEALVYTGQVKYCLLQPIFPGRIQHCSLGLGQLVDFAQIFTIIYVASRDMEKCPSRLTYWVDGKADNITLSSESAVHTVIAIKINIDFDQGCLLKGGSFQVFTRRNDSFSMSLTSASPFATVPLTPFAIDVAESGYYTMVLTIKETTLKLFDFFTVNISPTCPMQKPWGSIRIAEIISFNHNDVSIDTTTNKVTVWISGIVY